MGLSSLLTRHRHNLVHFIEPRPVNYKLNRNSNTNFANLSNKMRTSQRLLLGGASQKVQPISRINGGTIHFGNFYLGQPLTLNFLGRTPGQPGGGGSPPRNKF